MERTLTKQGGLTDIMITNNGKKSRAVMLHGDVEKQLIMDGYELRHNGRSVTGNRVALFVRMDKNND